MSATIKHQKLIERYFEGDLSPAEHEELNHLLSEDKDVQKDFETMKMAVEAIRTYGFREMLNAIKKELYPDQMERPKDPQP